MSLQELTVQWVQSGQHHAHQANTVPFMGWVHLLGCARRGISATEAPWQKTLPHVIRGIIVRRAPPYRKRAPQEHLMASRQSTLICSKVGHVECIYYACLHFLMFLVLKIYLILSVQLKYD